MYFGVILSTFQRTEMGETIKAVNNVVTPKMNDMLHQPFNETEIKVALF